MSDKEDDDIIDLISDDEKEDKTNKEIVFPVNFKHPPLTITAPDYSYVMDITDMKSLLITKYYDIDDSKEFAPNEKIDKKNIDAVTKVYTTKNPDSMNKGYKFILTIIDTTSRKVWMYPMKSKNENEVYNCFQSFMKDVHGKVARMLSDMDSGFNKIKRNNNYFTYCSVNAGHNNHKTLSLIDRFTRTFRLLLYKAFRYYSDKSFSWYAKYKGVLNTYNNSKHYRLFLRGKPKRNKRGEMKKFYYTPNQVWYSPRLRSRIRLRAYCDGLKNYEEGSLYDQIAKADKVRVRMQKSALHKGGENFFTNQAFKKGIKRGNAWWVNGKWYTYRNLLPVGDDYDPDDKKHIKKSKYKFDKFINVEEDEKKLVEDDKPPPERKVYTKRKRLKEIGELKKAEESFKKNRKGRTMEDIEKEDEIESESDEEKGYHELAKKRETGMTLRSGKKTGRGFKRKRNYKYRLRNIKRKLK